MEQNSEILRIGKIILDELQSFSLQHTIRDPSCTPAVFVRNTFKDSNKTLAAQIQQQQHINSSLRERSTEPFIAYVETLEDSVNVIYLVCRGYIPSFMPNTPGSFFLNYHSDLGKAVETDAGQFYSTRGAKGQILSKNLFKPVRAKDSWDAIQNEFSFPQMKYLISSIIELFKKSEAIKKSIEAEKNIEKLAELQRTHDLIITEIQSALQGRRRHIRSRIELRDQQILDTVQGELFRTHFHSQIVITGGPGTGKTTTVIKRIARQTNYNNLTESNITDEIKSNETSYFHLKNWYLYTPTPLLKQYLKENISKEGLPASDDTVKVWEDERKIIARDVLRILRVKQDSGFVRCETTPFTSTSNRELTTFSKEFEIFYLNLIDDLFNKTIDVLSENQTSPEIISFFLKHRQNRDSIGNLFTFFLSLAGAIEALKRSPRPTSQKTIFNELADKISSEVDTITEGLLRNIDNLLVLLCEAIKQEHEKPDTDTETLIDEELETPITNDMAIELKAKNLLKTIIRGYAFSIANNKKYTPPRHIKAIYPNIESFLRDVNNISGLGKLVADRRAILPFSKGYHFILNRIPQYYRDYRSSIIKSRGNEPTYNKFDNSKLSDTEIDILVYSMLRNAWRISKNDTSLLHAVTTDVQIDNVIIANILSRYRTQIAIDEVTDFSTLQIACMCYMCHPKTFSISLVGDLMQRVTTIGLSSWEESHFDDISFIPTTINKVYRQNPKLLKIASELYQHEIGNAPPYYSAFENNDEDPEPLILIAADMKVQSEWIAKRISETYIGNQLPTTAVFVSSDDDISNTVKMLSEALENYSIEVKGCPGGEILGTEGKVAVFSIKFLKGLEFESVFLMCLDTIHSASGDLFDKYLYVGITRAASFLAVTCKSVFPDTVNYITHHFKASDWSKYVENTNTID